MSYYFYSKIDKINKFILLLKSPFVMSLLLYIDPLANSYAINRWSEP